MEILIVNSLDHLFHISSIEPTDQRRLPQILPQSAKFLPRACSRRSRNIPSLPKIKLLSHPQKILFTLYSPFSLYFLNCTLHEHTNSYRAVHDHTKWWLINRDGILRERREHARGRNLADCGRICGSPRESFGSIEEMWKKYSK